jgi:hypothetical protein
MKEGSTRSGSEPAATPGWWGEWWGQGEPAVTFGHMTKPDDDIIKSALTNKSAAELLAEAKQARADLMGAKAKHGKFSAEDEASLKVLDEQIKSLSKNAQIEAKLKAADAKKK